MNKKQKMEQKAVIIFWLSMISLFLSIWIDGYHIKLFLTFIFLFGFALLYLSVSKKVKKEK